MSFPAYPEYKNSGNEFLGEVPSHWELLKLKHCAEVFPSNVDKKSVEGQLSIKLCNYTDVYYNEAITDDLGFMAATATSEQLQKFELLADDVVFTKDSESADDIGVAAYVPRTLKGVLYGYHLSIARPGGGSSGKFLKRFFDSTVAKAYFEVSANGLTRVGLGQYAVDNLPVALPPVVEQTQIARFLDHETARIDALIEEQQRLIELLKEKRQAVISHAVTKGLDPNVPMKDSGVEWLGEVPEHWDVVPFSFAIDFQEGPGILAVDFQEEGVPLLRVSGVQGRWATLRGCNYLSPEKVRGKWNHFRLQEGDLLISASASMGTVCEVGPETVGAVPYTGLIRLRPRASVSDKDFVRAIVGSYQFSAQIDLFKAGSTIQHFGPTHLSQMKVVLPPVREQVLLAEYIDGQTKKFEELLSEAEHGNILLQERRSALISAAVTGKIDVRNWQPDQLSIADTGEVYALVAEQSVEYR